MFVAGATSAINNFVGRFGPYQSSGAQAKSTSVCVVVCIQQYDEISSMRVPVGISMGGLVVAQCVAEKALSDMRAGSGSGRSSHAAVCSVYLCCPFVKKSIVYLGVLVVVCLHE